MGAHYYPLMETGSKIDAYSVLHSDQGIRPPIKRRAIRVFKMAVAPRHWVRGDPFATSFFNALSAVFPHGEAFMIRSLAPFQNIAPTPLNRQIASFIEQESGHSRDHAAMNKGLVAAGFDVAPLEIAICKFVARFATKSDLTKVAGTMCIEHITAIVGAEILKNPHHLADSDDDMRELWLWHGVEEVEHKAVAFDTWIYLTQDWTGIRRWMTRMLFMAIITASFVLNRTRGQIELLRQDGYGTVGALRGIIASLFGRGKIGRNVMMPWLAFFKPGFHPWDIDDSALIIAGEAILAEIEAAKAPTERRKNLRLARAA
jgi:uncharacterized protein